MPIQVSSGLQRVAIALCLTIVYFYEGTVIEYRNWHLGLGRRFRSLKLWFVLRSFGVEGFRKHIRRVSFPSIQTSLSAHMLC